MESQRLYHLDMAKGVGIILVVLGHIEQLNYRVLIWLSSFHVPLFFVISGILLAVRDTDITDTGDLKRAIQKRARGILVPYFWFSSLYICMDLVRYFVGDLEISVLQTSIVSSLTLYGHSVLWFLAALFFSDTLFFLLRYITGSNDFTFFLLVAAITACALYARSITEAALSDPGSTVLSEACVYIARSCIRIGVTLPFTSVSYLVRKYILAPLDRAFVSRRTLYRILLFAVGSLLVYVSTILCFLNWGTDTNQMVLGNYVSLYYANAFAGSMGVLLLCKSLPPVAPLAYLGRNSLVIMALHLHCFLLLLGLKCTQLLFSSDTSAIFITSEVMFTLIICIIPIEIINRFAPFVLGKAKKA